MVTEVLPRMAAERKSTYEQLMALLFVANQVDDDTIPYMTMSGERGCSFVNIINVDATLAYDDECICNDQDNIFFWISLLNQMKLQAKQGKRY